MSTNESNSSENDFEIKRHGKVVPLSLAALRHVLNSRQVEPSCPARRVCDKEWSTIQRILQASKSESRQPVEETKTLPKAKSSGSLYQKSAPSNSPGQRSESVGVNPLEKRESQNQVTSRIIDSQTTAEAPSDPVTPIPKSSVAKLKEVFLNEANRKIDDSEWITIKDQLVIGSSPKHADWLVTDASVSAKHAIITASNGRFALRDAGSQSGTFLNELELLPGNEYFLSDGDLVRIGTARFSFNGGRLYVETSGRHAHLLCKNLSHLVKTSEGMRCILDNVSLEIGPNKFVVVLGPSGSGKSTLIKALNGQVQPTHGIVLLNHEDLYLNIDRLKTRLANVPQKDLFHESLSLLTTLKLTAELRLPNHKTVVEKAKRVDEVLESVGITAKAKDRISIYSGGEKKRASLANELLADPSLLFIDEATSGLDEDSDRDVMAQLRDFARAGKTVICITHNLSNVAEFADEVIVMGKGGHLVFMGKPEDALNFFPINHLAELYSCLKQYPIQYWQDRFKGTTRGKRLQTISSASDDPDSRLKIVRSPITLVQRLGVAARHSLTILKRLCLLQLKDLVSLAVTIAQPAFVFFLIYTVFGSISADTVNSTSDLGIEKNCPKCVEYHDGMGILFLLAVSSLWFGCNNASKELIKEKEIFLRERAAGLSPLGYLTAKAFLLVFITLLQTVSLLYATQYATNLSGETLSYFIPLLLVSICGVGLGLAISALATNSDVAATAVPLAMIPQVILAGNIKSLDGFSETLAWLTAPSHWAYGALTCVWNAQENFSDVPSEMLRDDMFAQRHYWLALSTLAAFSAVLFLISGSQLHRRKY